MLVRVRDRDQRAEVEDRLAVPDGIRDRLRVRQVAAKDLDLVAQRFVELLEPAVVVARVVTDERPDLGAVARERLREMAADEPGGAGDEHLAARPAHASAPTVSSSASTTRSDCSSVMWP